MSAPRWTDRRIIVGAVIVICSVTGVAGVVHNANDTVDLWAFRSDLAAGSRVTAQDVARVAARVPDPATYLAASQSPVGETVARPVAAGELVAGSSLQPPEDAPDVRLVTLPVARTHVPLDLRRGESVDVYVVERGASGEPTRDPRLVLPAATVADVDSGEARFGGSSLELGVALSVDAPDVPKVVAAESRGTITLVRVPGDSA